MIVSSSLEQPLLTNNATAVKIRVKRLVMAGYPLWFRVIGSLLAARRISSQSCCQGTGFGGCVTLARARRREGRLENDFIRFPVGRRIETSVTAPARPGFVL